MKRGFFLIIGLAPLMLTAMSDKPNPLSESQRDNIQLVRLAQIIQQRIFTLKDELNQDKTGHLYLTPHNFLSPEKYQTKSGIFLECEYGLPRALHLPYGHWQIVNHASVQREYDVRLMEMLVQEFELELVQKKSRIEEKLKNGTRLACGPLILIYAVHKVGQNSLEKGEYKDQTDYMDDCHAKTAWKALLTE
ncbi:hypothetical protein BH09DEP1_BH09DEP1_2410 [soil metagenome]